MTGKYCHRNDFNDVSLRTGSVNSDWILTDWVDHPIPSGHLAP